VELNGDFVVKELSISPVPILRLEIGLDLKPVLSLFFRYYDEEIALGEKKDCFIVFNNDNNLINISKIKRNKDFENEIVNYLNFIGLKHKFYNNFILIDTNEDNTEVNENETLYDYINFINLNKELFTNKNIELDIDRLKDKYFWAK